MKKLLFFTFLLLPTSCFANNYIDGYCQSFKVPQNANVIAMTVPAGKEFVLRKLHIDLLLDKWEIQKDEVPWLFGVHSSNQYYTTSPTDLDFPDGTAVVGSGQVLKLIKCPAGYDYYLTMIGYFRDVENPVCQKHLDSDINKDCKVDFADFAILANEWLATSPWTRLRSDNDAGKHVLGIATEEKR